MISCDRPGGVARSVLSTEARKPRSSTYEVGGQPPVTKGIQPPPPEPDGHVSVHPALQTQDLPGVTLHFRSAASLSRAELLIRVTPFLLKPCVLSPFGSSLLWGLCRPGHYCL